MKTPFLLHQLLQSAAATVPGNVAVVDRERSITYDELDARSNQLANLLKDAGVSRGDRVGLYLHKSLESIVGIYGVLKAGAAYVPLDAQAPTARLGYMARNCGLRCLLTGAEVAHGWLEIVKEGGDVQTVIVMNSDADGVMPVAGAARVLSVTELAASSSKPLAQSGIGFDLAYILYTSGSTGEPKGVMLSHRNALSFVVWAAEEFGVGAEDRLSGHAPLHFDLSTFDIFAAAYGGATLVLVPPKTSVMPTEVARFIDSKQITVWYSVPSVLSMLIHRGDLPAGAFPTLRTILFAGEVFPTEHLRRLMGVLTHVRFANLYGPTETNVCTYYDVPSANGASLRPIPIGRAIADVEVFAVGDDGRRAARGEVGMLWVRGPTVMQGYWGDEERTRISLMSNPLGNNPRDLAYRTGDLVREGDEGNFEYLGRRDAQIKSRGYRIELGEIETALYSHPSVVECAAIAVPDDLITNRIKVFAVVKPGVTEPDLARFCSSRLPRYMVPDTIAFQDALPKTSTGKVDRQSLTGATAATTAGAPPGPDDKKEASHG